MRLRKGGDRGSAALHSFCLTETREEEFLLNRAATSCVVENLDHERADDSGIHWPER